MIGKKVKYFNDDLDEKEGVIMDKVLGVGFVTQNVPSLKHERMNISNPIQMDFYLIKVTDCGIIRKIQCTNVIQILN